MKTCESCKIQKELSEFYTYKYTPKGGILESRPINNCKQCHNKGRGEYIRVRPLYQKKPKGIFKAFPDQTTREEVIELLRNPDIKIATIEAKYGVNYQNLRNFRKALILPVESQDEPREAPIEESSPTTSSSGN